MKVTALRSSYDKVGGTVHFGRMIDKIRLYAAGTLPAEYHPYLGSAHPHSFDGRCCRFLRIAYSTLAARAKEGGKDEELFQWACACGCKPSDEEIEIWNAFMQKRGWRDDSSGRLRERIREASIAPEAVQSFFDFNDADEGRPPPFPADPSPPKESVRGTALIPGLRSPYDKVGGIFHFGRMLDKIRLAQAGKLPPAWLEAKGAANGFDGICSRFLSIDYAALEQVTMSGRSDSELLEWAFANGRKPSEEEIEIWNDYLSKRCWRDQYAPRLRFRLEEAGMPIGSALTMFDFIDLDESRPLRSAD